MSSENDEECEQRKEEEDEEAWKDDDFLSFGNANNDADNDEDDGTGAAVDEAAAAAAAGSAPGASSSTSLVPPTDASQPLPPWMDDDQSQQQHQRQRHAYRRPAPLVSLHNEIVDFARLMEPREDEIREREELVVRATKLVEDTFGGSDKCEVKVFGSQATGLFLPTSDIDLVVLLPEYDADAKKDDGDGDGAKEKKTESTKAQEEREMKEWDATGGDRSSPLRMLGDALRQHWQDELSYLEVVEQTRIPIVKATHAPTNLSFDICINQETGTKAAELVKRFGDAMPPLRPLTFVLKYFMAARGLNEPYTGGVGSFMLQMMCVSFLQQREREEYHASGRESVLNLGSLLLEFFELYGMDFNYVTTGLSVRNDGAYFPKGAKNRRENFWQPSRPFSLALENPFEPEADVGRATYRMQLVQKSFEVAFRVLMAHVSEPAVPAVSILASILPPTDEMIKRATMNKVAAIEKGLKSAGYRPPDGSDMDTSSSSNGREDARGEAESQQPRKKKQRRR